nr:beta-galactosidase [Candidatus Sigynarchaeota archaeon]
MELNGITVTKHEFKVGTKSMFLLAGEIHYFRLDPNDWDDRLGQMKEIGCNAVSTYIPWNWHEEYKGKFDFTSPEKDLDKFLEAAELYKFKILARPGPWICSEWMNGAIPQWLIDEHPEILCTNDVGKHPSWINLKATPISYLHPVYLDHVKKWYAAVAPILKKHEHPRGGIILIQPDNELSFGFQKGVFDADYTAPSVEFYRGFLQKKYKSVAGINKVYGTSFKTLDKIMPPKRADADGKQLLIRCNDWVETKERIIQEYTSRCIKMLRDLGLKSPMYVNTPSLSSPANIMLQNLAERKDNGGLVLAGDDHYPHALDAIYRQDFPLSLSIEQLDAQLPYMPISWEFEGGHYDEDVGPNDAQMLPRLAVAHGLKAMSIYMMVGGRNPPMPADLKKKYKHPFDHYGTYPNTISPTGKPDPTGKSYDFAAAIGENGQKSDRFQIFQRFFAFVSNNANQLLVSSKVHDDIAYIHYHDYGRINIQTEPLGFAFNYSRMDQPDISSMFFQALVCLNGLHYQPKMVELLVASSEELAKYPVAFGCFFEFMDTESVNKLAEYVKNGGTLIAFFEIPSKTEWLEQCDLLTSLVPAKIDAKVKDESITALGHVIDSAEFAFTFKDIPDGAEVLATTKSGGICAYACSAGKGKIVHLGFAPPPENEGRAFLHDLLENSLKLSPPKSYSSLNGVVCVQQQTANGERIVAVANLWKGDERIDIMLDDQSRTPLFRIEAKNVVVAGRSCLFWSINKKLSEDVTIAFTTSELVSMKKEDNQLVVQGYNFKNASGLLWIPCASKPKKCNHKFTYGSDKIVRIEHDYPTEIQIDFPSSSLVFKLKGIEVPRD